MVSFRCHLVNAKEVVRHIFPPNDQFPSFKMAAHAQFNAVFAIGKLLDAIWQCVIFIPDSKREISVCPCNQVANSQLDWLLGGWKIEARLDSPSNHADGVNETRIGMHRWLPKVIQRVDRTLCIARFHKINSDEVWEMAGRAPSFQGMVEDVAPCIRDDGAVPAPDTKLAVGNEVVQQKKPVCAVSPVVPRVKFGAGMVGIAVFRGKVPDGMQPRIRIAAVFFREDDQAMPGGDHFLQCRPILNSVLRVEMGEESCFFDLGMHLFGRDVAFKYNAQDLVRMRFQKASNGNQILLQWPLSENFVAVVQHRMVLFPVDIEHHSAYTEIQLFGN